MHGAPIEHRTYDKVGRVRGAKLSAVFARADLAERVPHRVTAGEDAGAELVDQGAARPRKVAEKRALALPPTRHLLRTEFLCDTQQLALSDFGPEKCLSLEHASAHDVQYNVCSFVKHG
jgi:hypothetical protein